MGVSYYQGVALPQDYEKAVEWYQKAANQGFSDAQYNLGLMFEEGEGVSRDYNMALKEI